MAKKIIGLSSVLIGDMAADGDMGTTLTELLGATVKGSASLEYTEPSTTDIEIEEQDDPFDTLVTTAGKWVLKLESYNVSAKTMGDTCGGTYTAGVDPAPDTWESPDVMEYQEKSFRVTTKSGQVIDIPRLKYMARPTWAFTKGDLGKISLTGTGLKPLKAGVKTIKFTDPD